MFEDFIIGIVLGFVLGVWRKSIWKWLNKFVDDAVAKKRAKDKYSGIDIAPCQHSECLEKRAAKTD